MSDAFISVCHVLCVCVMQVQGGGKEIERVFKHISCRIEAEEAEGVREQKLVL